MLFNKKQDEDLMDDYAANARLAAGPVASNQAQPPKPRKAQTRSVIDPGLVITGTLEGDGELQIDGEVRGDIRCTHLTVGNAATVDGNIAADEVVIRGKVKGVIGANRVILTDGAHVESDIFHKRLAIEEGAYFDGGSHFNEQPMEKARSRPAEMASGTTPAAPNGEADDRSAIDPNRMSASALDNSRARLRD
jgi:cytoskeletal protein CcmA (bactofilin family)